MELARLPETSPTIDERLAALADPELADRLADVHPSLFPEPPQTERGVISWTARRFGVAAVALTALASAAAGYFLTAPSHEKAPANLAVPAPAPKTASSKPRAHRKPIAAAVVTAPAASNSHAHAGVTHAAPAVVAPVAHVPAPVAAPVAALPAHDDAQRAEAARLRARLAADTALIASLRARELAQTEAARAERIRAAQRAARVTNAPAVQSAHPALAAPTTAQSSADERQAKLDAAMQQGIGAAHAATQNASAPANVSAPAGASYPASGGDPSASQGGASGTDPSTVDPHTPNTSPPQGGHHGGLNFPFPVAGPVDSCSPRGGRLSVSQILIEGVLRSVTHGNF